jgi:Ca2+-binding RTX toxin-like protein
MLVLTASRVVLVLTASLVGLGADTFVIGSTGDGGDTIQDFSVAQGDVLDLSGIALGDTIVTNVSVAGGVGTLLAAGVNVIVYTADNAVDTAAEVDAMLLAQNGSLNQHQATYILTDNGTDTYVWVDDHLDLDNSGAGATLVATLVGVADASTIVIGTNFQG